MTVTAIVVMVLAMLLVWGGLAVSIVLLRRDVEELEEVDETGGPDGQGAV